MSKFFKKTEKTGEDKMVTDNRKPVIKVSLIKPKRSVRDVFAGYEGKIQYFEDILTDTSDEWGEK